MESTLTAAVSKPTFPEIETGDNDIARALSEERELFMDDSSGWTRVPVYNGNVFRSGDVVEGPALIEEDTTTIVLREGWNACLDKSGCYRIRHM